MTHDDERWLDYHEEIGEFLNSKYMDIFTTTSPTFLEDSEGLIQLILSDEENEALVAIPSGE